MGHGLPPHGGPRHHVVVGGDHQRRYRQWQRRVPRKLSSIDVSPPMLLPRRCTLSERSQPFEITSPPTVVEITRMVDCASSPSDPSVGHFRDNAPTQDQLGKTNERPLMAQDLPFDMCAAYCRFGLLQCLLDSCHAAWGEPFDSIGQLI